MTDSVLKRLNITRRQLEALVIEKWVHPKTFPERKAVYKVVAVQLTKATGEWRTEVVYVNEREPFMRYARLLEDFKRAMMPEHKYRRDYVKKTP